MERYTLKPFPEALGDLLRERSSDRLKRFSLAAFVPEVTERTNLSFEYARLMLSGIRTLRTDVIEATGEALGVDPHYFVEYRNAWVEWQMKKHPDLGLRVHDFLRELMESVDAEEAKG